MFHSPHLALETTGGLAPHSRRHVGFLTGRAKGKGAIDRTRYGSTRISTKSYFTHHTQQMSKAAVMYDAKAIRKQVTYLKQRAFGCAVRGASDGAADGERA